MLGGATAVAGHSAHPGASLPAQRSTCCAEVGAGGSMVGLRRGAAICACAGTSAVVLLRLIGEREKGGSGRALGWAQHGLETDNICVATPHRGTAGIAGTAARGVLWRLPLPLPLLLLCSTYTSPVKAAPEAASLCARLCALCGQHTR